MTCKCRQKSSSHFVVWCDVCKNDLVSEKEANPNQVHIKIDNFKLEEDIEIINLLSRMAKGYENFIEMNVNNIFGQLEGIQDLIDHAQDGVEKCFERIEKLESDHLDKLDPYAFVFLKEEINKLRKELETEINVIRALGSRAFHLKQPHKCPVCDGLGDITKEIHPKLAEFERLPTCLSIACKSCEGKGIVWG